MKLKLLSLFIFSVLWKVTFSLDGQKTFSTYFRSAHFETAAQQKKFIEKAPKGWFECTESQGGRHGYCLVSEMVPL